MLFSRTLIFTDNVATTMLSTYLSLLLEVGTRSIDENRMLIQNRRKLHHVAGISLVESGKNPARRGNFARSAVIHRVLTDPSFGML